MAYNEGLLAPVGSTGNNTHTGYKALGDGHAIGFQFVVEAVGATPTVTWKVQGSLDSTDGSDGHWYDLGYITDASDTIATATQVSTGTGAKLIYVSNPVARRYAWFRLVTTANTNVTYRGEIYNIS